MKKKTALIDAEERCTENNDNVEEGREISHVKDVVPSSSNSSPEEVKDNNSV